MDSNIDTVREALETLCEALELALARLGVCGQGDGADHKADADSIGGTNALTMGRAALAALSAIDPEDNALKVGRYFCAQMPCSPTDCTEVPCRYMKSAIANRNNRESEAIRREARAEALKEAADRAMMWWYEGDKAMTEMNQINSLRAAILSAEPAQDDGKPNEATP